MMNLDKRQKLSGATEEPELASVWTPAIVDRIAAHLPPNEAACVLRFVNKDTAEQLSDRTSVQLSQPVPRGISAARWQAPDARLLSRARREQMLCLAASAGMINLEVALAATGLVARKEVLKAAASAGQLECCRFLVDACPPKLSWWTAMYAAACAGHLPLAEWCWERWPHLLQGDLGFELASIASGGHRAVCEALLQKRPDLAGKPTQDAAVRAARGGHAALAESLLSLRPLAPRQAEEAESEGEGQSGDDSDGDGSSDRDGGKGPATGDSDGSGAAGSDGSNDGGSDSYGSDGGSDSYGSDGGSDSYGSDGGSDSDGSEAQSEYEDEDEVVRRQLIPAAMAGCDLAMAQRLCDQVGPPQDAYDWALVLAAALDSGAADWRAKAAWVLQQGGEAELGRYCSAAFPAAGRDCYLAAADHADAVQRFDWLQAHGIALSFASDSPTTLPPQHGIVAAGPFTVLRTAISAGNAAALEWLLTHGVGPEGGGHRRRAPHRWLRAVGSELAAEAGHVGVLRVLWQADFHSAARQARVAASHGRLAALRWLHETFGDEALGEAGRRGPPPPRGGLLDLGCASGDVELVTWLREKGCRVSSEAWARAVEGGCEAVLELLRQWQVPKPAFLICQGAIDIRTTRVFDRLWRDAEKVHREQDWEVDSEADSEAVSETDSDSGSAGSD